MNASQWNAHQSATMAAPGGSFSFRLKDYPLGIGLNRKYSLKCYYAVLKFPNFVLEVSYTTSLQHTTHDQSHNCEHGKSTVAKSLETSE